MLNYNKLYTLNYENFSYLYLLSTDIPSLISLSNLVILLFKTA